jgi:hypothetical protein
MKLISFTTILAVTFMVAMGAALPSPADLDLDIPNPIGDLDDTINETTNSTITALDTSGELGNPCKGSTLCGHCEGNIKEIAKLVDKIPDGKWYDQSQKIICVIIESRKQAL